MTYQNTEKPKAPSKRYQRHLAAINATRACEKARDLGTVPVVYFVRAKTLGLIKIGLTMNMNDRMKTLRVGSPDQLELVGAVMDRDADRLEGRLHARFADHRSHGEWFHPCPELLEVIALYPLEAYQQQRTDRLRAALARAAA